MYHQRSLTWCVQRRKPIPLYKVIFHLCRDPIVFVVATINAFTLFGCSYFLQMFEKFQKWDYYRIVMVAFLFLGCSSTYHPQNNAHRVAFALTLIGGLIFSTTLNTMVVKVFTTPIFSPQIQNINQILDGDFDLVGSEFVLDKLMQQNEVCSD